MTNGGNFRVLVVDDDELALAAISGVLAEAGCTVTNLATPIGVTQVVLSHDIDVVILDLQMPALPGDRLAAMLRGNKRLRDIPVVLVSAAPEAELLEIAKRLPGIVALPKRRVRTHLVSVVRELAVRRRGADPKAGPLHAPVSQSLMPPAADIEPDGKSVPSVLALRPATEAPALREEMQREIPRRVVDMARLWREASCGSLRSHQLLTSELRELRGKSELLELECLRELASALDETLTAITPGALSSASTSGAVLAGFNLLARLSRAPVQTKDKEVTNVLARLSDERKRLSDGSASKSPGKVAGLA